MSPDSDINCRVTAMNVEEALLVHGSVLHEKKGFPPKKKVRGLVENLKKEKDVTVPVTQFD